ncbi:hypothetical protein DQ04_20301000 [Trypanosoma grayi]|uniref:hypothetical protein n=1 Tax=Trypanosoma grayi TaxID=71804 RepID=UPI0004F4746D|nr:hypothetical protein DQ04_20301000 [Trypanosoma grayi]KEG05578.1 hypothetical protein DQ04_20301000 [Trypanosoma grayi]
MSGYPVPNRYCTAFQAGACKKYSRSTKTSSSSTMKVRSAVFVLAIALCCACGCVAAASGRGLSSTELLSQITLDGQPVLSGAVPSLGEGGLRVSGVVADMVKQGGAMPIGKEMLANIGAGKSEAPHAGGEAHQEPLAKGGVDFVTESARALDKLSLDPMLKERLPTAEDKLRAEKRAREAAEANNKTEGEESQAKRGTASEEVAQTAAETPAEAAGDTDKLSLDPMLEERQPTAEDKARAEKTFAEVGPGQTADGSAGVARSLSMLFLLVAVACAVAW